MNRKRALVFLMVILYGLVPVRVAALDSVQVSYQKPKGDLPAIMVSSCLLDGTPESVWDLVIDVHRHPELIPHTAMAFYLTQEGLDKIKESPTENPHRIGKLARQYRMEAPRKQGALWEALIFKLLDAPFPVVDRWVVMRLVSDETGFRRQRYEQTWTMMAGNIKDSSGYFRVIPTEDPSVTRLEYSQVLAPGGHLPEWIVRLGAVPTTKATFRSFQKVLSQLE